MPICCLRKPPQSPLDSVHAEDYDACGPADGGASRARSSRGAAAICRSPVTTAPSRTWPTRPARPSRDLGEQLRLSFADPVDRMIGAHLIALLCPAGRLTAEPAAIARAMAAATGPWIETVRQVMLRFDPSGMFARDLKECLGAQLADRNRLDPGDAGIAEQPGSAGPSGSARADEPLRGGRRGPGGDDQRAPVHSTPSPAGAPTACPCRS